MAPRIAVTAPVVCVGVNPAFDVTLTLDRLRPDCVSRVLDERCEPAGKAANVAAELLRLGTACSLIGFAGEENGGSYTAKLAARLGESMAARDTAAQSTSTQGSVAKNTQAQNTPTQRSAAQNTAALSDEGHFFTLAHDGAYSIEFVPVAGRVRENLTLLAGGETTKINRTGASCSVTQLSELARVIEQSCSCTTTAIFSGSMPGGMTSRDYTALMHAASAAGARIAVDTDALSRSELVSVRPWLYKPNSHELAALCKLPAEEEELLLNAAAELVADGVRCVLLTLGEHGLAVIDKNGVHREPAIETQAVCTVGAGDCTLAGFICGDIAAKSVAECAKLAAQSGAYAVSAH